MVAQSVMFFSSAVLASTLEAGTIRHVWTQVGQRNVLYGGAHWRYLTNTIEPPMCGGDAAFFVKLL